jgi:hypothetical protein
LGSDPAAHDQHRNRGAAFDLAVRRDHSTGAATGDLGSLRALRDGPHHQAIGSGVAAADEADRCVGYSQSRLRQRLGDRFIGGGGRIRGGGKSNSCAQHRFNLTGHP